MANIDLMLPDTIPAAMVDANVPAAFRRADPRWAMIRHADGERRTYVVPLTIQDGSQVELELLEMVKLTIAVEPTVVRLKIQPVAGLGLIVHTMAKLFALDTSMGIAPGTSKYVDFPSGMGRAGLRIPREA